MSELHEHAVPTVRAAAIIPVISGGKGIQTGRELETRGLVEALEAECVFVSVINVRQPSPATLLGSGQLESVIQRLKENQCDLLIVDGVLTPIQQRNLERQVACKVIDRTGMILEIFGLRARTRAGRLQVETARLAYERSRLVRTWTHLERQRGGQGVMSGPGETQIEADRRMIDAALLRLKKQLTEVERTRRLQRSNREARDLPIVALVGYTNAGKSTLFNKLSGSDVFAKDMPFATLDPTIRQVELAKGKDISLIDTVGFITDLPTALIESFKATLEESIEADLILHVHDASSPDAVDQAEDVDTVLLELEEMFGLPLPPIIHVWNKTDLIPEESRLYLRQRILDPENDEPDIAVSALTGAGLDQLKQLIVAEAFEDALSVEINISPEAGHIMSWIYRNGRIDAQEIDNATGSAVLTVSLSEKKYHQFSKQFHNESGISFKLRDN